MEMTRTVSVDDRDIEERFVRAAGPGRHIPRKATSVELRFDVGASSLPVDLKKRLLGSKFTTGEGVLVILSRVHRSQEQNRRAARARLLALVRRAAGGTPTRRPTRPRKAVRDQRAVSKRRRGEVKRSRHTINGAGE